MKEAMELYCVMKELGEHRVKVLTQNSIQLKQSVGRILELSSCFSRHSILILVSVQQVLHFQADSQPSKYLPILQARGVHEFLEHIVQRPREMLDLSTFSFQHWEL